MQRTPPRPPLAARRFVRLAACGAACLALAGRAGAQAPAPDAPPPADPRIAAMAAAVSPAELRATDERLVAFGTRDLYSETLRSHTRGVFAARDYLAARLRAIARTSGGRMTVALDTYLRPKGPHMTRDVTVSSVYATLRGDDPARATYAMTSHYDSRPSDGDDPTADAPGADDNGSGTAAVIEAARVMAQARFHGTIVFACFDGEEQGLYGSEHFAQGLAARGVHVAADLNDDIIGASAGHGGVSAPQDVRLFSEALPEAATVARTNLLGTENDSPSRELARFVARADASYVPDLRVDQIFRGDRFLRGGDQESFTAAGFPAVRFVEANENFDHQHQNVREEGGVQYGDLVRYEDFDYLARVTRANVAALAALALGPAAPVALLDASKLAYATTLRWAPVPGAVAYQVVRRHTDEPQWTGVTPVGDALTATLPYSEDDWLFGVRAVDAAGLESVVAFPTPVR